jgi:xanthine dehydrogenase YagS FAD-binding subunit
MERFAYAVASTVEEAVQALDQGCRPLAGGTDLVGMMKKGLTTPGRLVDLKAIEALRGIEREEDRWRIGALTTLSTLARRGSDGSDDLTSLTEAAVESASPQLRHVATLGGNLVQRPRCWYFRNPLAHCWLKGGDRCLAATGRNAYHAILGPGTCRMVHPSDPAVALHALDARVEIVGREGTRTLDLAAFFARPRRGAWSETVLNADELVAALLIPRPPDGARGAYVKVAERAAWDFALVSAAVQVDLNGEMVTEARVALGGVASLPWRAREAEERLVGRALTAGTIEEAASASSFGAAPLPENGYKVQLVEGAVREALRRVSRTQAPE